MNKLFGFLPKPRPIQPESRVYDLKSRLDWGEPALTIIDVRDRASFNEEHITGAISIPAAELLSRVSINLEYDRDLYLYAGTDDEATTAAEQLRAAGYQRVSVLRGGAAAWKAAGFPVEANTAAAA